MGFINITIEKVVVRQDDELLKEINCKLDKLLAGNVIPQEVIDKLNAAIEDIKGTIS